MKENLTAIFGLVDGSGSMEVIRKGVIDGFNEFLVSQKKEPGDVIFSLVQFSRQYNNELIYNKIYNLRNIKEIEPLTEEHYNPSGGTPLLDAMGRAINELGEQLAAIPEQSRPSKVIFLVITDGYENSSHEFSKEQIKSMTTKQENVFSWQFVYLGANQDSFAEAANLGILKHSTVNYQHTYAGMTETMRNLSASVGSYRSGQLADVILTDDTKTTN